jgi:prepilin-type N-terminal cleavage/methylation domain-containing protein
LDRALHRLDTMRNGTRGFSLIEVLVATALIVVALTGLAQVFVIATAAGNHARAKTIATILAQEKLDDLVEWAADPGGGSDFIDARGQWLEAGVSPPSGTAYIRRWSVDPLPDHADEAFVLQVWVTLVTGVETARLVSLKSRRLR